jgi:hypothetical protein
MRLTLKDHPSIIMDVHSNLERNWQQFPLLAKIITEQGRIPDRLYRGGASYHKILDDFHDWMLMGSQVVEPGSCQPDMSYVESTNFTTIFTANSHSPVAS